MDLIQSKRVGFFLTKLALMVCIVFIAGTVSGFADDNEYTSQFPIEKCWFMTRGVNPYFILKPGYLLVYEGEEDGDEIYLEIIVLRQTKNIYIEGIGRVRTRVVEEREWINDEIAEVSRNYFAISMTTNDIYYFGEDVDIYEDGEVVSHDGAWLAGRDGAMPGVMMPGTFLLGSRYYQEVAPDVALDRAENVDMGFTMDTDAGTFENCVEVLETTPLEPDSESTKIYCPGVGLIQDDVVELTKFGFVSLAGEHSNGHKGKKSD